jgi:hypothetical protein
MYSVSSTNKTDHHDMAEILLKMALNTINLTQTPPPVTNHSITLDKEGTLGIELQISNQSERKTTI